MKNLKLFNAFTLSEVLMTVSILGIIATLTIPSIHYNYKKLEYKTKVKKAMYMYDGLLRRIHADYFTSVKTNEALYTKVRAASAGKNKTDYCAIPAKNIKFIQRPGTTCTFQTGDGVWIKLATDNNTLWAKVAMTQADLNDVNSNNKGGSYKKVVWFFASFGQDGALHINDQQAADAIDSTAESEPQKALTNLYNFIK